MKIEYGEVRNVGLLVWPSNWEAFPPEGPFASLAEARRVAKKIARELKIKVVEYVPGLTD